MPEGSYQLSYNECIVSVPVLQNQVHVFDEMYSNICGRSASYNAVANTTATEFSALIHEDIKAAADENEDAWGSAVMAAFHAVGVIKSYTTAVQAYKSRIDELEEELATEVASAENDSDKEALVEEYNGMARTAWQTLETEAENVSDMLADGPTPEHIRALTEAGYLGDVPGGLGWVVTGEDEFFAVPPGMDGSDIGETFQLAADGDEAALERLDESLALMNAFMAYVARKQEDGSQLTDRELEILMALNAHMDDADPSESSGVGESSYENPVTEQGEYFNSIEAIRESEHLSEEQRERLLSMIGGSVLAASDERMGGNYENLPEAIQNVVEGPRAHSPTSWASGGYSPDWAGEFELLTEIFAGANQNTKEETGHPLQGGTELSAITIGTIAGATESTHTGGVDEEVLRTMLDIATQNRDANFTILTGEYPSGEHYQHPVEFVGPGSQSGTDEAALVAALLSHDWDHGGETVRGLTDWIAEDGDSSNDTIKERADRAFEGLIGVITDPESQETLASTGYDVEGEGPDGEDFTWRNAPMGLLNPEISDSFAGIFETYIDEFADTSIMDGGQSINSSIETNYNSTQGLVIDLNDRAEFTSLISGDGEAMGRMFEAAQNYAQDRIYEHFTSPDAAETLDPARAAGLLWNSVGFGMADAVETRFDSHNEAIIKQNQSMGYAVDMMAAGIPDARVGEPIKLFLKEMFNEETLNPDGGITTPSPGQMSDNISSTLDATLRDASIEAFYDSTREDRNGEGMPQVPEEMIDENEDFIRDWSGWGLGDGESRDLRDSTWGDLSEQETPMSSEGSDMATHFGHFMEAMNLAMRASG
ncbi:hypothetical protein [Nocardiopsis sp. NRRL B-16309]|uniref:TPR repeat region-containing protein n=1 Tax=Nocardiopsis sp. NRRL B-16309 TaxID=1519494 RepID=UPI000A6A83A7|nr:hypothetical protein [Nocardiopsis sp. NRRL B-16309]